MNKTWLVLFLLVFVVALAFLIVGAFMTEHSLYTHYGETGPGYTGSDPQLLREFSFA